VERDTTRRQLFDELYGAISAEADHEMEILEAAWSKYLGGWKGSLFMVLNDGLTFTGLEGCQIVSFPDDWTEQLIDDALKAEAERPGAHGRVVDWFDQG
jgi:hypothetical protein